MAASRVVTGQEHFDIDAREAQVGKDPRIAPLTSEEFTGEARQLVAEARAQFGMIDDADVPAVFGILFKHPGLYRSQLQLGIELSKNGNLPPRERELAILRVSWLSRSPFEWGEHVEAAKRMGLSAEEVERVTLGSDAPGWGEHDRAIVRAVEELMGDYAISDETWAILAKSWTESQLMELPGVVGAYVMTAYVYNTLRIDMLEGNTGLRRR